ncbi:hypothetical protein PCE1_002550 [Barthelona sp. PCE]
MKQFRAGSIISGERKTLNFLLFFAAILAVCTSSDIIDSGLSCSLNCVPTCDNGILTNNAYCECTTGFGGRLCNVTLTDAVYSTAPWLGYETSLKSLFEKTSTTSLKVAVSVNVEKGINFDVLHNFPIKVDLFKGSEFVQTLATNVFSGDILTIDTSILDTDTVYTLHSSFYDGTNTWKLKYSQFYGFYLFSSEPSNDMKEHLFSLLFPSKSSFDAVIKSRYITSIFHSGMVAIRSFYSYGFKVFYYPYCNFSTAPTELNVDSNIVFHFEPGDSQPNFFSCLYREIVTSNGLSSVTPSGKNLFDRVGERSFIAYRKDTVVFCPPNRVCTVGQYGTFIVQRQGLPAKLHHLIGGEHGVYAVLHRTESESTTRYLTTNCYPLIEKKLHGSFVTRHDLTFNYFDYEEKTVALVLSMEDQSNYYLMGMCTLYGHGSPTSELTTFNDYMDLSGCTYPTSDYSSSYNDYQRSVIVNAGELVYIGAQGSVVVAVEFYPLYMIPIGPYYFSTSKTVYLSQTNQIFGYIFSIRMPNKRIKAVTTLENGKYGWNVAVGFIEYPAQLPCQADHQLTDYIFDPLVTYTITVCYGHGSSSTNTITFQSADPIYTSGTEMQFGSWATTSTLVSPNFRYAYADIFPLTHVTPAAYIIAKGSVTSSTSSNNGFLYATRKDGTTFKTLDWAAFWRQADDQDQPMVGYDDKKLGLNVMSNLGSPAIGAFNASFASFTYSSGHNQGFDLEESTDFCRTGTGNSAGVDRCTCGDDFYGDNCQYMIIDGEATSDWTYTVARDTRYLPNVFKFTPQALATVRNVKALYNVSVPLYIKVKFPYVTEDRVNFGHISVSTFEPRTYYDGEFSLTTIGDYLLNKDTTGMGDVYQMVNIPLDTDDDVYVLTQFGMVGAEISVGFECAANCHGIGICGYDGSCSDCAHADRFCNADFYPSGCPPGKYIKQDDGSCEPVCDELPDNADCVAPDVFVCKGGYELNADETLCVEACTLDCVINSKCVRHNVSYQECVPKDGYKWVDIAEQTLGVEPICANGCPKNSRCNAPDTCACMPDYSYDQSSGACEPNIDFDFTVSAPYYEVFNGKTSYYRSGDTISGTIQASFNDRPIAYFQASILYMQLSCNSGKNNKIFTTGVFSKNGKYNYGFKLDSFGVCELNLIHKQKTVGKARIFVGYSPDFTNKARILKRDTSFSVYGYAFDNVLKTNIPKDYSALNYINGDFVLEIDCDSYITSPFSLNTVVNFIELGQYDHNMEDYYTCDVKLHKDGVYFVDEIVRSKLNYSMEFVNVNGKQPFKFVEGYSRRVGLSSHRNEHDLNIDVFFDGDIKSNCNVDLRIVRCYHDEIGVLQFCNNPTEWASTITEKIVLGHSKHYSHWVDVVVYGCTGDVGQPTTDTIGNIIVKTRPDSIAEEWAAVSKHPCVLIDAFTSIEMIDSSYLKVETAFDHSTVRHSFSSAQYIVPWNVEKNINPARPECQESRFGDFIGNNLYVRYSLRSRDLAINYPFKAVFKDGRYSYNVERYSKADDQKQFYLEVADFDFTEFEISESSLCGETLFQGKNWTTEPYVKVGMLCNDPFTIELRSEGGSTLQSASAMSDIDFASLTPNTYQLYVSRTDMFGTTRENTCNFKVQNENYCARIYFSNFRVVKNNRPSLTYHYSHRNLYDFVGVDIEQISGPQNVTFEFEAFRHIIRNKGQFMLPGTYHFGHNITLTKKSDNSNCMRELKSFSFKVEYPEITVKPKKTHVTTSMSDPLTVNHIVYDKLYGTSDGFTYSWACRAYNETRMRYDNELCDTIMPGIKSRALILQPEQLALLEDNTNMYLDFIVSHNDTGRSTKVKILVRVFDNVAYGAFDAVISLSRIGDVRRISPHSANVFFDMVPRNPGTKLNTCTYKALEVSGAVANKNLYDWGDMELDAVAKVSIAEEFFNLKLKVAKYERSWSFFNVKKPVEDTVYLTETFKETKRLGIRNYGLFACSSYKFEATCNVGGGRSSKDEWEFATYCPDTSGYFNVTKLDGSRYQMVFKPSFGEKGREWANDLVKGTSVIARPDVSYTYTYINPVTHRRTVMLQSDNVRSSFITPPLPFANVNVTFGIEVTDKSYDIKSVRTLDVEMSAPEPAPLYIDNSNEISAASTLVRDMNKALTDPAKQASQNVHLKDLTKGLKTVFQQPPVERSFWSKLWNKRRVNRITASFLDVGGVPRNSGSSGNDTIDFTDEEIDAMTTEELMPIIDLASLYSMYDELGVISPIDIVSNLLAMVDSDSSTALMPTVLDLCDYLPYTFLDEDTDAVKEATGESLMTLVNTMLTTLKDRQFENETVLEWAHEVAVSGFNLMARYSNEQEGDVFDGSLINAAFVKDNIADLVNMTESTFTFTGDSETDDDRELTVGYMTVPFAGSHFEYVEGLIGFSDVFSLKLQYQNTELEISDVDLTSISFGLPIVGSYEKNITASDITVMRFDGETWVPAQCSVTYAPFASSVSFTCTETGAFAAFITKSMSCGSTFFGEDCDECVRNHYGEHCEPCPLESPNGICDAGISGTGALVCVSDAYSGELCDTCNSGYYEQGSACITCPPCERGTCLDGTGNGTCQCEQYFTGTLCNMCEFGRTGTDCDECIPKYYSSECIAAGACIHGTLFDGFNGNGSCVCNEGYTGADCSETDSGYYGPNAVPCRSCENGGTCDDGTSGSGMCLCPAGYNPGTNCSTCMPGYVGASCELARDCGPGGVVFDGITGNNTCLCATGFNSSAGGVCDVCESNRFGAACTVCPSCDNGHCSDTASGDGKCICDEYWSGALCDECIPGRRGSDCSLCMEGLVVDSNDECVLCDAGYFGAKCEKCPACVHGTCNDTITGDGMCLCDEGTTGGLCDQTLPGYRIENNTVIKTCLIDCQGNSFCNESLSDPICVCRAGWSGANCDVPVCNDCAGNCVAPDTCVCSGTFTGASCDECKNGWEGDLCNVPICNSTCVHGTCVAPERCECDADFRGVLCDEAIPKCPICPTNGFCNKDKECQCKHGWTGDECDEQVTLDESNSVFYKRINNFDSEPVLSVIIGNNTYVILDDAEIHRITNNEDEKISEALEGDVVHVFVQEEFAIYHDDVVKVFSFSAKEWEPVSAPSNGAISIAPNSIGIGVVDGILFVGSNHVFMDMPSMNLSTVNITDSPNLGPSAIFDAKSTRHSNVVVHADTQLKLYGYLPDNRWVTYDPIDIECPAISVNIFDNDVIIVCPTLNATHAAIVNVSENSHTIEYIQTDTTLLSAGHLTIDDDGLTIVGQHSTTTIGTKPPVEVDPFAVEATAPQTVSGDILVSYDGDLFIVSDIMPYVKRYVEADDRWDEYTMSVTTTATDFIGNCAASRASTTGTTTRIVCVDADQKATLQVLTVDWELSTIYMDSIPIASDVAELSDASLAASETHFFIMGKTAHSSLLFKIDNVFMSTLTVSLKDTVPAAASTIVVDDDIYMFGGKPVTQVMYVVNTRSGVVTKNDVNDAHVAFAGLTGGWKFGSKLATYGTNPVTGTTVGFVIDTETLDVLRLPAELGGVSLDGKVVKSLGPRTGGSALVLLADDMAGTNPSVVEFTFYDVCGVQSSSGSVCNVETGTYVTDPEPEPEKETSYFGIIMIAIFITIFVIGAIYMNKKVEEKPEMDLYAPNFMQMEMNPSQTRLPFSAEVQRSAEL